MKKIYFMIIVLIGTMNVASCKKGEEPPVQTLIKCDDATSFVVHQKENLVFYIELRGKVEETTDHRVIFKDCALQTDLKNKKNYFGHRKDGKEDFSVINSYLNHEARSINKNLKKKLIFVKKRPFYFTLEKKAIVWSFLPTEGTPNSRSMSDNDWALLGPGAGEEIRGVRPVYISTVIDDFIYTIQATPLKERSFDEIESILLDLMGTENHKSGNYNEISPCQEEGM